MTLREQVEALEPMTLVGMTGDASVDHYIDRQAVLDLIDAHACDWPSIMAVHRCIDPERLARALHATVCGGGVHVTSPCMAGWADRLAAAYEKEDNL